MVTQAVSQLADSMAERFLTPLILAPDASQEFLTLVGNDYLYDTVAHLDALGIKDGPMHRLKRQVEARQATRDRAPTG